MADVRRRNRRLAEAELAERARAQASYRAYLRRVHGKRWKETRMSGFIADSVQRFLEEETGSAYDILVIETPPQHGKSMTVTESLPAWYLGRNPENRVIIASYDSGFAERFCRRNREKITGRGQKVFPLRTGAIDRADELELANGRGCLMCRGIMAGITGNPANLIIIDDPVKNRQEADSPTYRARLWNEWQNSLKSRLCAGGKVILIMTPWHEDDLAARVLRGEPGARLLRLPVEAEENDPLGRVVGEALCPELGKDKAWLESFKESYLKDPLGGRRAWQALYQCSPRTEEGNLIRRDWWQRYDPADPPKFEKSLISVDAAFKGGENNDYVSIQVWGRRGRDCYLRYCLNRKLDFPGTLKALRQVAADYPEAKPILIEDKANGPAIVDTLRRELFVVAVSPQGGKLARVNAVSAAIESGHVFLPTEEKCAWAGDFADQFAAFPKGANDDMVDAATQALNRMLAEGRTENTTVTMPDAETAAFTGPELFGIYG